jgi:multiple sugar transport system ATP-binding protein
MTLADRIALMNTGLVEQVGAPRTLYDWPATRYVAEFLGSPGMNFITGTLAGAIFETAGVRLPVHPDHLWESSASGEVTAGVRPHAMHVMAGDQHHGSVEATVEVLEPMGWETHAHLTIAGDAWTARLDASEAAGMRPGDRVTLYVDPADVRLFDAESGRALTHRPGDKERYRAGAEVTPG